MIKKRIKPVDIVVVTYNRIHFIKEFLLQLIVRTDYPYRLIVVDNGSKDGTREWIKRMKKKKLIWKYVFNKKSLPLTLALAEGFKEVKSELFVTTSDDVIPSSCIIRPCWLSRMVELIKENPEYASISMAYNNKCWHTYLRKNRIREVKVDKIRFRRFMRYKDIVYEV